MEKEQPEAAFARLSPSELDRLSDQALVDYIRAAHLAADPGAEKDAIGILVNGFWPQIQTWVRLKTPESDVEDVAGEVVASLMRSTFDGKAVGQFGAFVKRICQRRVADYWIDRGRRLEAKPLGEDLSGDEGSWGEQPSTEDETAEVEFLEMVERVLATRSEPHRLVIRLYGPNDAGFMDLPAAEVAAKVNDGDPDAAMSEANVHQIWKRFKTDLGKELGLDG